MEFIQKFCLIVKLEWLKENYFHAILEITKSVAERLRQKSGYTSDGADLVDDCFALGKDKRPMLAFNTLKNQSEESEHKGFGNFCKGFFFYVQKSKSTQPQNIGRYPTFTNDRSFGCSNNYSQTNLITLIKRGLNKKNRIAQKVIRFFVYGKSKSQTLPFNANQCNLSQSCNKPL